jgi:CubicO group peptidase (beta-lactamase class C family)
VSDVEGLVDELLGDDERFGTTYAAIVQQRGTVVAERYGGALPHFDRPPEPVGPETPLLSWSMAKSVLHAAVGILVGEDRLALDAPLPVPEWSATDDPRRSITLDHLLCMRDGLDFCEDYVDDGISDVIAMLFGDGRHDVAHYAAERPLAHAPGTTFNYSSGTSNIVSRAVGDAIDGDIDAFLRDRIFGPLGMRSARVRVDEAGTWIGSSYVYATAHDFVRFAECYLHDGRAPDGTRVVPDGWVEHGRRPRSIDADGRGYGAHWWVLGDEYGTFYARGYEGQRLLICPPLELVVARLGRSNAEHTDALFAWCDAVVAASA